MACDPATPGAGSFSTRILESSTGGEFKCSLMALQDLCNKRIEVLEVELKDTKIQIDSLNKTYEAEKVEWEMKIRESQEAVQSGFVEAQLRSLEIKDLRSENGQLKAKCQELETLASGAYSDGSANPTILDAACKSVYRATISLGKALVEFKPPVKGCSSCETRSCCEESCQRNAQDLQLILSRISPADMPINPKRPSQVKHTWGHWICSKLFVGFESSLFDLRYDESDMATPMNLKTQATTRFQRFLQQKERSGGDLFFEDRRFRSFCVQKYQTVFPSELILQALHPQYHSGKREILRNPHGRFPGDEQIHGQFLEVAKFAWLLHHLAFSFDPPASIVRMEPVTLFDERYHIHVVSDGEDHDTFDQAIVFVITPTLQVGKTIIKSHVFLLEG